MGPGHAPLHQTGVQPEQKCRKTPVGDLTADARHPRLQLAHLLRNLTDEFTAKAWLLLEQCGDLPGVETAIGHVRQRIDGMTNAFQQIFLDADQVAGEQYVQDLPRPVGEPAGAECPAGKQREHQILALTLPDQLRIGAGLAMRALEAREEFAFLCIVVAKLRQAPPWALIAPGCQAICSILTSAIHNAPSIPLLEWREPKE